MNSVIEQPTRAELQVDPTAQLTQFHDDVRGDPLLGSTFETVFLYRGHFGDASGFELIALEARHGGR
ncbi:MAG: hypothetical protein KA431_13610 [Rubrivivax sp.]|nr:hypothetical protein [Rubrivivax sp.]